jgi:hypothetical protein
MVNDAAEQGISFLTNFNSVLTDQEEQKQYLLQVIKHYCQHFLVSKKSVIIDKHPYEFGWHPNVV